MKLSLYYLQGSVALPAQVYDMLMYITHDKKDASVSCNFDAEPLNDMCLTISRPGDQHRTPSGIADNPFEEPPKRVREYTAQEIATLQARLDKQLGPEYISARPGPGGQKVHYISAEKCISLANEIFGFNGWSSSIRSIQIDFVSLIEISERFLTH